MIDITPQIRKFTAGKAAWAAEHSLAIATEIAHAIGASVDWDKGSGENWIRIICDTGVLALISALGPLAVLTEEVREVHTAQLEAVIIPSIQDVILTADREALIQAFGDRIDRSSAFDPNCFSAEELWFVSV
jgi:hypothetical protein